MFAKVFNQIFDSSIAECYLTRLVFTDMLTLCDINGVVDMTHEAIARRTNVPLETVRAAIKELESPDPRSRTPDNEGRRIIRMDEHRDWGWMICNYERFRKIASEEQRREKTAERVRKHRSSKELGDLKRSVTHGNACNAMQKQRQKQMEKEYLNNIDMSSGTNPPEPPKAEPPKESASPHPAIAGPSAELAEVFNSWNDYAGNTLPRCLVLSDKRRRHLKSRLSNPFFRENWRQAIIKISQSSFCCGQSGGTNGSQWRASFDWFLQPDTVAKVMEGKYDGKTKPGTATIDHQLERIKRESARHAAELEEKRKQNEQWSHV